MEKTKQPWEGNKFLEDLVKWKGYHYTSMSNWENIKKDGRIKPHLVTNPEILKFFPGVKVEGVWVWDHMLNGISHAKLILSQAKKLKEGKIVLLKINFPDKDDVLYSPEGNMVNLNHVDTPGEIYDWLQSGNESCVIWTADVPLDWISEVTEYDIVDRLK